MSEQPFHDEHEAQRALDEAAKLQFNDELSQRILQSDPNKRTFAAAQAQKLTIEFELTFPPLSPDAKITLRNGLTKIIFAFTDSNDHAQTLDNDTFTELMGRIAEKTTPHENPQLFSENLDYVAGHILARSAALPDMPLDEKVQLVIKEVFEFLGESPKKRILNPITLLRNFLKRRKD